MTILGDAIKNLWYSSHIESYKVCEQMQVVEVKKMGPSLPLLSCESPVSVKEIPNRKKKIFSDKDC